MGQRRGRHFFPSLAGFLVDVVGHAGDYDRRPSLDGRRRRLRGESKAFAIEAAFDPNPGIAVVTAVAYRKQSGCMLYKLPPGNDQVRLDAVLAGDLCCVLAPLIISSLTRALNSSVYCRRLDIMNSLFAHQTDIAMCPN